MKKVLFSIMALILCAILYTSFGTTPDVVFYAHGHYKFGINYSEHQLLKLCGTGAVLIYVIYSLTNKSK